MAFYLSDADRPIIEHPDIIHTFKAMCDELEGILERGEPINTDKDNPSKDTVAYFYIRTYKAVDPNHADSILERIDGEQQSVAFA